MTRRGAIGEQNVNERTNQSESRRGNGCTCLTCVGPRWSLLSCVDAAVTACRDGHHCLGGSQSTTGADLPFSNFL